MPGGRHGATFAASPPSSGFQAVNDNMVAAIELIRVLIDGMIERKFGRIVDIAPSSTTKSPIADLSLSTAARLGLTGYVAGVSRQLRSTT